MKKGGWRKWLLRDQPCVRLASGDINTSGAAGATILPFTAGEGDKRALTKGKREKRVRGLACLHSPQANSPIYRYSTSWWKREQRGGCSFPTALVSRLHWNKSAKLWIYAASLYVSSLPEANQNWATVLTLWVRYTSERFHGLFHSIYISISIRLLREAVVPYQKRTSLRIMLFQCIFTRIVKAVIHSYVTGWVFE